MKRYNGAIGLEGSTPIVGSKSVIVSPIPSGNQFSINLPAGRIITNPQRKSPIPICKFGSLVREGSDLYILGGSITAGAQIWEVANKLINTNTTGSFLTWLSVDIVAMSEDDLLMPGIESSSEPVWTIGDYNSGYPDMVFPSNASPNGTAVIPLGLIKVSETGGVSFSKEGCGSISLSHCFGQITINRS